MRSILKIVATCSVATIIPLAAAHAQTAAPAWSATVGDGSKSASNVVTYQPLTKATKKWQICDPVSAHERHDLAGGRLWDR